MTEKPYFQRYENLDTHWYACRVCGGTSMDSDTAALAGKSSLAARDVTHSRHCPGAAFPDSHVRRITKLY